ncbi:MAG: hypothetical protein LH481_14975 [Burkholderiales bacterium]|nr:hypothetical protein [Burkholderiales bacterium]
MKKTLLLAIFVGLFSIGVHADYDPLDDPNSPQFKKAAAAEQARAAKKKAETDEKIRVARVQALRNDMGKDAIGKSDAEVEAIYNAGINDAKRIAAGVNAASAGTARQTKKSGASEQQQAEAMMKALTGSNSADVANMSPKERDAFAKEMEKKYGGK